MSDIGRADAAPGIVRRIEFWGFFVAAPVLGAVLVPPNQMFAMLFALTGLGLVLLHLTPGFRWGELAQGLRRLRLRPLLGFAVAVQAACVLVVLAVAPGAVFGLPRHDPALMAMIALLYPPLSALPQELVYRALFFRRYGALVPGGHAGILANAALFALAHLMYWSGLVLAMTFAGGLIFAWAYRARGSFPLAVVLHALAGIAVFAAGLGLFFYSGAVQRPF